MEVDSSKKDLEEMKKFIRTVEPGFCPSCWMILDFRCTKDMMKCNCCPFEAPMKAFDGLLMSDNIEKVLNINLKEKTDDKVDENEGAETEHLCPKCGHDRATLKTMQLRGADEGQTCFYTCVKCKFTDKEDG